MASLAEEDSERAYAPIHSPVPSLGRYLRFCSSVPYQTMGRVPMPTCALPLLRICLLHPSCRCSDRIDRFTEIEKTATQQLFPFCNSKVLRGRLSGSALV